MDYEKLKEVIANKIKENGKGEITGPILQAVLMAMVDSLGEVYPQNYTEEEKARARANIEAQSITDAALATIAKTIVGAINEVFKGGLEDASIATNKIEDGAVTEDKLASQSVSSKKIKDATIGASKLGENSVTTAKIKDGAVSEPKLDENVKSKINNNLKVVEQALTDTEINIASKNLMLRAGLNNFFADKDSYKAIINLPKEVIISSSVFGTSCYQNQFGEGAHSYNRFGNYCRSNRIGRSFSANHTGNYFQTNTIGDNCRGNIFGNNFEWNSLRDECEYNTFGNYCRSNIFKSGCKYNTIGHSCKGIILFENVQNSKIDSGVESIVLRSNATKETPLQNIHILSGVRGSYESRLVINIPDEYLNSSRELIITTKVTNGGPSTPEDLVMYYADEVVDKQNKQDNALETTSKEVIGAINEVFNGGLKDKSIAQKTLAQPIQDTLNKVGMNVKVLPAGTDLKSDVTEPGVYILSGIKDYLNRPNNWEHYNSSIYIVSDGNNYNKGKVIIGFETGSRYPYAATLRNNEWKETILSSELEKKLNNTAGSVGTKNLANGAVTLEKLASAVRNIISGAAQKALVSKVVEVIELTDNNTQNKAAIDAKIAKLTELGVSTTNGYVIPISYISGNKEYHGTITAGKNSLLNGIVSDAQGQSYFSISVGATDGIVTFDENDPLVFKNEMQSAIDTLVTCVEFTKTTLSNKAQLDAYLAKIPNAKVMCCTYNGHAGMLHKINGNWYGVLVDESNTLAGQLSIKLQADGTIVEGTA